MTCIYLINWSNNGYFYVGQTQNMKLRKSRHLRDMRNIRHHNKRVQNVFNKYGEPQFHVVEECEIDELNEREQFYLDLLFDDPNCLNLAKDVLASARGRKFGPRTPEVKEKLRKANLGKPQSKIAIEKNRQAHLGARNHFFGKKHTTSTKEKQSEVKVGSKNPNAKAVTQFTIDGSYIKEWSCMKMAADYYKICKSNISAVCRGIQKSAAGYVWRFANE